MKSRATIIRKLYLSVISTILLVISLTSATYAWFQINSTATVSGFDFTAVTGLGFKVSIDDKVYANDLSSEHIKMAILNAYDSEKYKIETSLSNDNTHYVQSLKTYTSSEDEQGKPIVITYDNQAMNDEIKEHLSLLPLTSKNGIDLYDLYNSQASLRSGRFIEFSVYFKAESTDINEKQSINIYLSGEDREELNGQVVGKTSISSDSEEVNLLAKMITFNNTYAKGDKITVSSVNALRYSIEDASANDIIRASNKKLMDEYNQKKEENPDTPMPVLQELNEATIYEPHDSNDLGSYATANYNGKTDAELEAFNTMYDATKCASYTYYNYLKGYKDPVEGTTNSYILKAMNYEDMPKTIRSLVDADGKDRVDLPIITNVKSGEAAKKVTFRFWLEGWDADCFDGIAKSINVKLSFKSVYLKNDNE